MRCWLGSAVAGALLAYCLGAAAAPRQQSVLDRVASAVDAAESSHGEDMAMWRPDPSGPQGPMQVSAAAASDVGGGDRFDTADNLAIGRAYLEQLYRRYRNWPDAIAAYDWGIGKLNAWLAAGRPANKLATGVAAYTDRVLRESGLCDGPEGAEARRPVGRRRTARPRPNGTLFARSRFAGERLGSARCANFSAGAGNTPVEDAGARWRSENRLLVGLLPQGFWHDLDAAMDKTRQDLKTAERR